MKGLTGWLVCVAGWSGCLPLAELRLPVPPAVSDTTTGGSDTTITGSDTATVSSDTATESPSLDVLGTTESPLLGSIVSLSGGTFTMGSPASEISARADEFPEHEVTLSPFAIMEREVTQAMYQSVMGANPSFFYGCSACPVENVTWAQANSFAVAVATQTGEPWRLPTEAEWEYAARGREDFLFAGSDDAESVGWCSLNALGVTHEGCTLDRNGFGLCDMSGNVWEWTSDLYGLYTEGPQTDPVGAADGSERVNRGGSYGDYPNLRVAARLPTSETGKSDSLGFRLVRSE